MCEQWFSTVFVPEARARNSSGKPIVLILDGHGSHVTKAMRDCAMANNIELFCLPPHTTHKTQPLDVGIFGPLQRHWMQRCDEVLDETGEEIPIVEFIMEYMYARELSFLPETIQSAFKRCGINPFDPNIFTDADFLPSAAYSTQRYVPSSYPADFYGEDPELEGGAVGRPLVGADDADDLASESGSESEGASDDSEIDDLNPPARKRATRSSTLHQSTPTDCSQPSTSSSHHQTSCTSSSSLRKRRRTELEAEIIELRKERDAYKWQAEAAQMNATMAGLECEELMAKAHAKSKKKEQQPTVAVAGVRWLTGPSGREIMDAHDVEVEARKQKEAEKIARKSQVEVDRQTRRGDIASGTVQVTYGGALGPKNMEDLRDIAWGLGLKEEGIKADYIKAIKDHLDSHPDLRDHPRWAGLYHRGQRRQQAPGTENVPPLPAQPSTSTFAPPTPSMATHSQYLDSAPYLFSPASGPYQSYIPYQPSQYIRYSNDLNSSAHNVQVHTSPPPHNYMSHSIPPNNFYHTARQ